MLVMSLMETVPRLAWAVKANKATKLRLPDDREWVCEFCGAELGSGKRPQRLQCLRCSVRRSAETCTQLHYHEGEHYETWRRGMVRALRKL